MICRYGNLPYWSKLSPNEAVRSFFLKAPNEESRVFVFLFGRVSLLCSKLSGRNYGHTLSRSSLFSLGFRFPGLCSMQDLILRRVTQRILFGYN